LLQQQFEQVSVVSRAHFGIGRSQLGSLRCALEMPSAPPRFALAALLCASAAAAPASFAHPGVVVGAKDLADARARIAAGTEPTASFATSAASLPQGKASYVAVGPPSNGTISCGYYDKPDIGCSTQMNDVNSAFTQALLFSLGGDAALAAASRATLALYWTGLKRYTNNSEGTCCGNEALQAAWIGVKLAEAGELLRWSPGSGWTDEDSAALNALLYNVHVPLLINGSPANGNWAASFFDTLLAIAVFSENATLYDRALLDLRQRLPSYFYITSDGSGPPADPQPNCQPQPVCEWYGQKVFDARVSGVCQETCRDMGHMQMGFTAFASAAATATLQGDDVLREQAPRLFAAAEFASSLISGARSVNDTLLCSNRTGGVIGASTAPTFELAHKTFARLGMDDVQTRRQLANVRSETLKNGQFYICGPWETIAFGLPL